MMKYTGLFVQCFISYITLLAFGRCFKLHTEYRYKVSRVYITGHRDKVSRVCITGNG